MDKVEYLIKNYDEVKLKLALVRNKLLNFKGFSEESVIESMVFERSQEERVQSSNTTNRSENLALTYHERLEQENREYLQSLKECYDFLNSELTFFEETVALLSGDLKEFAQDLIFNNLSWDDLERKYEISRSTISYRKQKVVHHLRKCYEWMSRSIVLDEKDFQIPFSN